MFIIEFVDYNEAMLGACTKTAENKSRTRRSGRKKGRSEGVTSSAAPTETSTDSDVINPVKGEENQDA